MRKGSLLSLVSFGAITAGAAMIAARATRKSVNSEWYARLPKPRFQPPREVFGPVWTALYAMIAVSGSRVWRTPPSRVRTRALTLWGAQLALNAGWSVIFFGARRPRAALAEIVALLASILAYAKEARKVDGVAALLVAPYAAWTGYAALINAAIVRQLPRPEAKAGKAA